MVFSLNLKTGYASSNSGDWDVVGLFFYFTVELKFWQCLENVGE